jgi:hypothetical protein
MTHGEADPSAPAADREVLRSSRVVAGLGVAVPLVLAAASGLLPRVDGSAALVIPSAVAGAAGPVVGYRLYQLQRERLPRAAAEADCRRAFLRATVLALGITEGAALLGIVVHGMTGELLALIGLFMHVLLAGALWPTEEKLQGFLTAASASGAEG